MKTLGEMEKSTERERESYIQAKPQEPGLPSSGWKYDSSVCRRYSRRGDHLVIWEAIQGEEGAASCVSPLPVSSTISCWCLWLAYHRAQPVTLEKQKKQTVEISSSLPAIQVRVGGRRRNSGRRKRRMDHRVNSLRIPTWRSPSDPNWILLTPITGSLWIQMGRL